MALFNTYDTVGLKEDISDIITNISPTKTPFQSMIGNEKVHNTLFQWQEDALASVAVNAQIEGFTASDATLSATTMRTNYTQILQKTIKVSGTNDAVSKYGRAKESAYQMAKAAKEVKRDLENAMVGILQAAVAGDDSTARKFASAASQITSGNIVHTGGAGTAPTEAMLLTALSTLYTAGVDPTVIMCTAADSQVIAGFAAASGRYRTIETSNPKASKTLVNAVDLYVSPFGEVKVVLNRFLNTTDTLVFDPDMWKQAVLRNWFREVLAKTGDNLMQMIVGEFSLKHKNFAASAAIRKIA